MVQWMRTRRPQYRGGHRMETERPSASFMLDVGVLGAFTVTTSLIDLC